MWKRVCIILILSWVLIMGKQDKVQAKITDNQFEALQKQLDQQQMMIRKLEQKIEYLENNGKSASPKLEKAEETNERLEQLSDDLTYIDEQNSSMLKKLGKQVKLNFYATLEYENFQDNKNTFDARNVELLLNVVPHNRLRGFAEIEFERTAQTSTGNRQGDVEVEQGWIEYQINPYINSRAGVILVPFGRYNIEHFDPIQDLTSRPIMARRVVPTTWGEAGAGFRGLIPLENFSSWEWLENFELNYQAYVINGLTADIGDSSPRSSRGAFGKDNNNNKALVGRLQITPMSPVQLGVSGYWGEYDNDGNNILAYDLDCKITYNKFEFLGEFANFDLDSGLNENSAAITQNLQGGYVEARYHFWPDFLNDTFLKKGFDSPTFTAIARAGYVEIEDDGDTGERNNKERRLTLGFNYRPTEALAVKIEYQFNDTKNEAIERGNSDGFLSSISAAF